MQLPQDVLSHIFGYVDLLSIHKSIQLVCTEWNEATLKHIYTVFSLPSWVLPPHSIFFASESEQPNIYSTRRMQAKRCFDILEQILININAKNHGSKIITHFSLDFCACIVKPISILLYQCPNITHLSLRGNVRVNDNLLLEIIESECANTIKSLNISSCRKITDYGIGMVCFHLPNLTEIYLRGIYRLTDESLQYIAKFCGARLRLIDLHGLCLITDIGIKHLATSCPSLEYLDLQNCVKLTGQGLAKYFHDSNWNNLQTLILKNTGPINSTLSICSDTIIEICAKCTKLKCIELQGLNLLDDRAFEVLQNLVRINIMECPLLTNQGLHSIGLHNPQLQEIELKMCGLITEEGVNDFSRCSLNHLRILNLTATSVGIDISKFLDVDV
jgi:hypothetical protein